MVEMSHLLRYAGVIFIVLYLLVGILALAMTEEQDRLKVLAQFMFVGVFMGLTLAVTAAVIA